MTTNSTRNLRPVIALAAALGLSACAATETATFDVPASRNIAPTTAVNAPVEAPEAAIAPSYKVVATYVTVPETLKVSEANRYYPSGDIVWREDPPGNRHEQVKAIVEAGLKKGTDELDGDRAVVLDVVVSRFHALTEKARYTVGGVHAVQFTMMVRDAETGEVLMDPHFVKADFPALGGQEAVEAEANGITQKVRIVDHLAFVIGEELGKAAGYAERDNGLVGAINQL
ncbi:MAG: hypothetical protein QNJ16_17055 [Rhodobacter sp.]|nr:hypothetical protein [Rhodobacter sp.]